MSRYSEYDGHPGERRILPAAFVGHRNHQGKSAWPCLPDPRATPCVEYGRSQKRPGLDALDIAGVGTPFGNPHNEKQAWPAPRLREATQGAGAAERRPSHPRHQQGRCGGRQSCAVSTRWGPAREAMK